MTGTLPLQEIGPWHSAPPVTAPAGVRDPIVGLVARDIGSYLTAPAKPWGGVVADIWWSEWRPTEGGPIDRTPGNRSAGVLNSWSTWLAAKASGLPVRFRQYFGPHAPSWALGRAGSLLIGEAFDHIAPRAVVNVWTDTFAAILRAEWDDTMAFAQAEPSIAEVATARACTIYNEPCIRNLQAYVAGSTSESVVTSASNVRSYTGIGLTGAVIGAGGAAVDIDPVDRAALEWPWAIDPTTSQPLWEGLADPALTWPALYHPFNPVSSWRSVDTAGDPPYGFTLTPDPGGAVVKLISGAARNLGRSVRLANNSYSIPESAVGSRYITMYDTMLATGLPVSVQSATHTRVLQRFQTLPGQASATLTDAATYLSRVACGLISVANGNDPLGVTAPPYGGPRKFVSMEVSAAFMNALSDSTIAEVNAAFAANLAALP